VLIIDLKQVYYRTWFTREGFEPVLLDCGRNVVHVQGAIRMCAEIVARYRNAFDMPDAAVCVCLDSREKIKQQMNASYKANRTSRLDETNYAEIDFIAATLTKAGANFYQVAGYEADDLIYSLLRGNTEKAVIYTNDVDLLMHIDDYVEVWLKDRKLTRKRFDSQLAFNSKREAWFNDIVLFKSVVGDSGDNIKGVKGFGVKAYEKKMKAIFGDSEGIVSAEKEAVREFVRNNFGFDAAAFAQFEESLEMVFPLYVEGLETPVVKRLEALRELMKFGARKGDWNGLL
jgi:5'-3' exonuclease